MVRVEAVEGRREETALGRIEVVRGTTVGAAILNRGVWLTELTTEGRMVRRNNQELLTAVEIVRFLAETVMPTLAVETVRGTLNQTETVKGTPGVGGRVTSSQTGPPAPRHRDDRGGGGGAGAGGAGAGGGGASGTALTYREWKAQKAARAAAGGR